MLPNCAHGVTVRIFPAREGGRQEHVAEDSTARIDVVIDRGEDQGCVNLSELSEAVQELELDEDQINAIHERIEARGLEVTDDCGRAGVEQMKVTNGDVAGVTTDALQLFFNEIRRHPL